MTTLAEKRQRYIDIIKPTDDVQERLDQYVVRRGPDECWEWRGPIDQDGYARFVFKGTTYRGHRLALLAVSAPPSPDHVACHTCDNPPCTNPAHLWWGTSGENTQDCAAKGRIALHRRKLSDGDVQEIRRLRRTTKLSHKAIGAKFGVTAATVGYILSGETFAHVPDPLVEALQQIAAMDSQECAQAIADRALRDLGRRA